MNSAVRGSNAASERLDPVKGNERAEPVPSASAKPPAPGKPLCDSGTQRIFPPPHSLAPSFSSTEGVLDSGHPVTPTCPQPRRGVSSAVPRNRSPLPPTLLLFGSAAALAFLGPQRASLVPALLPWALTFGALAHLWLSHRTWLARPGVLIGGALLLRVIFLLPLPDLSDDLYRYVWDGLLTLEGVRPYTLVPADPALSHLHGTDLFREMNSPGYTSIYPPLSQWIFLPGAIAYRLWGWPAAAWAIKGGFLLLETLGVLLMYATLRRLRRPPAPLALYAWNPLALVTIAGGGHTEGGLVLGIGLLLYGLTRAPGPSGAWLSWAGWGLAVLSKGVPLVLAPLVWRALGPPADGPRRRFREVLRRLRAPVGVLLAMGLLSLPFLRPADLPGIARSARLYTGLFEFNAGLYYLLKGALEALPGATSTGLGSAMGVAFLVGALFVVTRHRARGVDDVSRAAVLVFSLYLVLATTVHPWYLIWVLAFLPFTDTLRPAWLWASAASLPTYLTYTGVPHAPLVALFWGGWLLFAGHQYREFAFRPLRRIAARRKAGWIGPHLAGNRWLDVGGGEGGVARALERRAPDRSASTWVADPMVIGTRDTRRVRAEGERLPFGDGAFDAVVLCFVLHHTADPDRVLAEALRVTADRVVILESTPSTPLGSRLLALLDRWVNEKRGDGSMGTAAPIHYRRGGQWEDTALRLGARVILRDRPGRIGHPVTRLVIRRAPAGG
ncbi:MAG: methyltransferase domain-containing protein [Gemmatimonadales bacterium]|nr:MAG: methyltransferase domain-containing protein [Gemmatimonadales bacterium]